MPLWGRLFGRLRHRIGYGTGAAFGLGCVVLLLSPEYERWRSPGPANAGHEALACSDCHRAAKGTMRQQLQANVRYLIGLRDRPVDFGLIAVDSPDCMDCHPRPTDRHPIYRFFEPRFADAREAIQPQRCISCHREHTGRRVTQPNGFCKNCHGGLSIPADPAEPTHEGIVKAEAWNTCLRCHDFHGNHEDETPEHLADGVTDGEIERYLEGGASPYSKKKRYPAREERTQ
jgi:hypothetical protein